MEEKPRVRRASSANLYSLCPAAAHDENDEVLVNPVDDAGTLGTAVHEAAAEIVMNQIPDYDAIQSKYNLDAGQRKELEIMAAVARRFWDEYAPQFGQRFVEHAIVCGEDTGHCDVIGDTEDVVRVLDWKTTRLSDVNYTPQMMTYLWLALSDFPRAKLQYIICFLRDKTIEVSREFSAEEVCQWHAEYVDRLRSWDGRTYNPGGHCGYCRRKAVCPSIRAELAQLCDDNEMAENRVADLPSEVKVSLWERIGMAQRFLERAREIIKLQAEAAGGTLNGEGKSLVLKEQQKQSIRAREAWPVLTSRLTEDDLAPAVSIKKTELLDAVAAKAPRGEKKHAKEALMEELEAAGAVETTTYLVPRIVAALPVASERVIEAETEN